MHDDEPTTQSAQAFLENLVQACYVKLKEDTLFTFKEQQQNLSFEIAKALEDQTVFVGEAPTGTGKTIGYLTGAVAFNAKTGTPVVIATGTKALQEQILYNDIPKMEARGILSSSQVGLAKGKRNYICIRNSLRYMERLERLDSGEDLFEDSELPLDVSNGSVDLSELETLIEDFEAGSWDGEFDHYKKPFKGKTFYFGVDGNNCTHSKCAHYGVCPYYKAKRELAGKQIVVTNHSLLMEDLKMDLINSGQGGILPFEQYALIIDEGHHLPKAAMDVGASKSDTAELFAAINKMNSLNNMLEKQKKFLAACERNGFVNDPAIRLKIIEHAVALNDWSAEKEIAEMDSGYFRFKGRVLDPDVLKIVTDMTPLVQSCITAVAAVLTTSQNMKDEAATGLPDAILDIQSKAAEIDQALAEFSRGLVRCAKAPEYVKWMEAKLGKDSCTLCASPLNGAVVLKPLIWDKIKNANLAEDDTKKKPIGMSRVFAVAIVSATLRDLNGFDSYKDNAGLPTATRFMALEPTFDYAKSKIILADFKSSPKQAERSKFEAELKLRIFDYIDETKPEGCLIVFQSWRLLKEIAPLLKARYGSSFRIQGELPPKMLIAEHKAAIDRGQFSGLAGVATLSEGLDLPGNYCTRVIVPAIPFGSPADPVEEEISDVLGPEYFGKRSLPDASIKLNQQTGRLLRRISDSGTIVLLDNRFRTQSYGKRLLSSLPKYTIEVEKLAKS